MKKHVFNAGPGALPDVVLRRLADDLPDHGGMGYSLLEASHRGGAYEEVHSHAIDLFRRLLGVPDSHEILFLQGGATLQFAMVPMNLLSAGRTADYVVSGAWAQKAVADAEKIGSVTKVWDGSGSGFTTLPDPASLSPSAGARYFHLTSNETIDGIQFKAFPDTGATPLVADMSSDILSRVLDVGRFGLIYAGAQKNLGPAGLTVVVIRKDLAEASPESLPAYLRYGIHAGANSLYNTPPVFAVVALAAVLDWVEEQGGLAAMQAANDEKAKLLYGAIDGSGGFYRCPADPAVRSAMNVVFRLSSEELEKRFLAEATAAGMVGLKGHRSVGGLRASIYNAVPRTSVEVLVDFMNEFARTAG